MDGSPLFVEYEAPLGAGVYHLPADLYHADPAPDPFELPAGGSDGPSAEELARAEKEAMAEIERQNREASAA